MSRSSQNWAVWLWLVVVAVMVATVFSVRWAYPLYKEYTSNGKYTFVPLAYGLDKSTHTDDYFYYARIKEMIQGRLFSFDPIIHESEDAVGAHSTYQYSFALCALGGLWSGKTEDAYYFNLAVFPALSFVFAFLLVRAMTGNGYLAVLAAATAVLIGMCYLGKVLMFVSSGYWSALLAGATDLLDLTSLHRTPNVLVTNVQLLLFANLLFLTLALDAPSRAAWVGLTFVLGFSSLTSTANFVLSYAIYVCCLLSYRPAKARLRRHLVVFLVALILSIPGVWVVLKAAAGVGELTEFWGPRGASWEHGWYGFLPLMLYLSAPLVLWGLIDVPHKRFGVGVSAGVMLTYLFLCVTKGCFWGAETVARGSDILIAVVFFAGCGVSVLKWLDRSDFSSGLKRQLGAAGKGIAISLAIAMSAGAVFNQVQVYRRDYVHFHKPDFKGLCTWLSTNLSVEDVVTTLDFDLLMNLPANSPPRLYIPQVMQSPRPTKERHLRFYESACFYGLSANEVSSLLDNMVTGPGLNPLLNDSSLAQRWFMHRVLFYCRYTWIPMPAHAKAAMVDAYGRVLATGTGLTYKADYLIVSPFDRTLIRPGSFAERTVKQKPVFENSRYSVYRLPNMAHGGSTS